MVNIIHMNNTYFPFLKLLLVLFNQIAKHFAQKIVIFNVCSHEYNQPFSLA